MFSMPYKFVVFLSQRLLTDWDGWPYNPLIERGRRRFWRPTNSLSGFLEKLEWVGWTLVRLILQLR
jgi:hypothetical protein